jgi:hypothetical protein
LFRERKARFTLLSLLSALVVASTAFVGVSIYAQTDDSELTTFEEEAIAAGEQFEDMGNSTSDDAAGDGSTSIADVSVLEGLVVCDLGTSEITGETEVASFDETTTPTVSVTVMSETEVAELAASETETASAEPARCVLTDGGDGSSGDAADATPDADSNATSATTDSNATSTSASEDSMSTNTLGSDGEILVIQGQDFASGQVVLMFTENALVGIDDVDENGEIEAKIPVPDSGETQVAGATELRFLESGTQRTATFEFDGETLTASDGGDIEAEGGEEATLTPAPLDDSANDTSSNNTNSTQ